MAIRKSFFTHQVIPGSKTVRCAKPFRAIPITKAMTMAGSL